MDPLDPSKIEQYRQLCEEIPEPEPLEAEELHDVWQHGNQRRPVPPKLSDNHKAGLVDLRPRWIAFAATVGHQDWRTLIKTLSYENKGLGEAFVRYLMRRAELQGRPIQAESAIRAHIRKLGGRAMPDFWRTTRPLAPGIRDPGPQASSPFPRQSSPARYDTLARRRKPVELDPEAAAYSPRLLEVKAAVMGTVGLNQGRW
jgi:hypothetical protein